MPTLPCANTWLSIPFQFQYSSIQAHQHNIKIIPSIRSNPLHSVFIFFFLTIQMSLSIPRSTITLLLSFLSILGSFSLSLYYTDYFTEWSTSYFSILTLLGLFLIISAMLIVAARAAIVAWITVLVLLAFSGKRRRVLVRQGRMITTDIAMLLVRVLLKERGFLAVACATFLSFMAVVHITETD